MSKAKRIPRTLVLDLDKTILYTTEDTGLDGDVGDVSYMRFMGMETRRLCVREDLEYFFKTIHKTGWNLIVWTASVEEYALPVWEKITAQCPSVKKFGDIVFLTRKNCVSGMKNVHLLAKKKIVEDVKRVLIVDDQYRAVEPCHDRWVPIRPYVGKKGKHSELRGLANLLRFVSEKDDGGDVMETLKEYPGMMDYFNAVFDTAK